MKPSTDLFDLIHSLTQAEKHHFRVYSRRYILSGEKNYLRLFEAIESQKEYDETALKKKFAGQKFVKQISVTKTYLYKLIMDSLEVFDSKYSPPQQLKKAIHQAEILYRKNLHGQAGKLLKKTEKKIRQYEMLVPELELLMLKIHLSYTTSATDKLTQKVHPLEDEEEKLIEDIANAAVYHRFSRKVLILNSTYGPARNKRELSRYLEISGHPLMKDVSLARSWKAKASFYSAHAICYLQMRRLPEAYESYHKLAEIMEDHPDKISDGLTAYLPKYVAAVYHFLVLSAMLNRFDALFEKRLNALKAAPEQWEETEQIPPRLRAQVFINYNIIELSRCLQSADFERGISLIPSIQAGIEKHGDAIDRAMLTRMQFYAGLLLLYAGKYGDALPWFNEILNNQKDTAALGLYGLIKLLNIIIHFELGNEQLLEYHIKSTYGYLSRMSKLYRSEKLILKFFRNEVPAIRNERMLIAALKRLHAGLKELAEDPFEGGALRPFDLLSWLESRIEGRPLPDIVKEKTPAPN